MRIRSVLAHSAQAVTRSALVALLVVGLMAGTTFAAKGGGGGGGGSHGKPGGGSGGGTLALVVVTDANANGLPNWADQITFTVSTTATAKPLVVLYCYQSGALVYQHSAGFYPGYPWPDAQVFTLSSSVWTGGSADCSAQLYMSDGNGGFITLATRSVPVGA